MQLCHYGFRNYNGIVHNGSYGQHQREEREEVQREACQFHYGKSAHKGHDYGDGRDEGGLEILQEEEYHQDDQENGKDQGLHHVVHGGIQEVVAAQEGGELEAGGGNLLRFPEHFIDFRVHGLGVGAGGLVHNGDDGRAFCAFGGEGIVPGAQLDIGHISEAQYLAAFRAQDDAAEFLHGSETAAVFQFVFVRVLRHLAQGAHRSHQALRAHGRKKILRHELVCRHYIRFHPDTQGERIAQALHLSNACHTGKAGLYGYVQVVGNEFGVIGAVRTFQLEHLQDVVLLFGHAHAKLQYFLREERLRHGNPILHVHGCHVRVGARLEEHEDGNIAGGGGGGFHVIHVLHAVDGFFQGLDYGLDGGLGICAVIVG